MRTRHTTTDYLLLIIYLVIGGAIAGPLLFWGWQTNLGDQANAMGGALLIALGCSIIVAFGHAWSERMNNKHSGTK